MGRSLQQGPRRPRTRPRPTTRHRRDRPVRRGGTAPSTTIPRHGLPATHLTALRGIPKTHQRREVPTPKFLAADLARHLHGKQPDDLVFAGIRNSQPLRVSIFRTTFDAAARAIGVPDLHPHELRHTAASLAIASGADVKVVQQMLGHGSATMTLDTYGHLFEDRLDEVGDAMGRARDAARARHTRLHIVDQADPAVAQCCPSPMWVKMPKGPCPAFPLVRTPIRCRTPDRI